MDRHSPEKRENADMSRTERLLDLIQKLRRHRLPVSGAQLADELTAPSAEATKLMPPGCSQAPSSRLSSIA
jgi:hypothetical protein